MRIKSFFLSCLWLAGLVLIRDFRPVNAQKTIVRRCKTERVIKYKVNVGARTIREPFSLIMVAGIKADYLNREGLMLLARQVKTDFCHEPHVYVFIYDDPRAVKQWHWAIDHERREGRVPMGPLRGTYLFDRNTGEEKLTFSTKRENPIDEVTIIISEPKQQKE